MKKYVTPNAEQILIALADVIATSLNYADEGMGDSVDFNDFVK